MDELALRNQLNNLEALRTSLHSSFRFWDWIVVVGVALEFVVLSVEYWHEWTAFWRATIRLPEKPLTWLFLVGFLGIGMVAGGIAEELSIDSQIEQVETDIRGVNGQLFGIVSKEADDLNRRLGVASRQMGDLEKNVEAQGPRSNLIAKVAPELAKKLASFAGQRVELFVCGQQGLADQETLDTWGAIANILDSDTVAGVAGAKWKEVPTNLNWAGNCGAAKGLGRGVGVMVSNHAPQRTVDAANALGHGLAAALPPSPDKMPGIVKEDFIKSVVARGFMSKDAPWTIVAFDSDLITVVIGEHP